jgi:hypothetical protein
MAPVYDQNLRRQESLEHDASALCSPIWPPKQYAERLAGDGVNDMK